MEELRKALWRQLQDIEHDLAALEAVTRALASAGDCVDGKDIDNIMWHISETLQGIRADVDEATGMTIQMKTAA